MILKYKQALLVSITTFGLAACNAPQASDGNPINLQAQSNVQPVDPDAASSPTLAAAEPFETLTEQAPHADRNALQTLIAATRAAAAAVAADLSDEQREALQVRLSEIDAANSKGDQIGIALASVEGYRILVESAPHTGKVPQAVSLLDYAGFRYQADLAASPVRWADASSALAFADDLWGTLEAQIEDRQLREKFSQSLLQMHAAAESMDTNAATNAASRELDLVDRLENYFNSMP